MAKARLINKKKYIPVELTLETREEFDAVNTLMGISDKWLAQALKNAGYEDETVQEVCRASTEVWQATSNVIQF